MRIPPLTESLAQSQSPPPPSAAEGEVEVWREQGQVCAYGYAAVGGHWMHLPEVGTFRLGSEVVAFPHPSATPALVGDAFERSVLPMALQALGGEALHASGVLGSSGVVALCGESGTGKSTLASALTARGYALWADDAVAFEIAHVGVVTVPLPFRINGRHQSPKRTAAPLAAAVILRRDVSPVSARRLEGGEAFGAALEQAYCYKPSNTERTSGMVSAYLELVARVPVIEVRFEPAWGQLDLLLDALEEIVNRP